MVRVRCIHPSEARLWLGRELGPDQTGTGRRGLGAVNCSRSLAYHMEAGNETPPPTNGVEPWEAGGLLRDAVDPPGQLAQTNGIFSQQIFMKR